MSQGCFLTRYAMVAVAGLWLVLSGGCADNSPEALYARAQAAADRSDYRAAVVDLKRLLKDAPGDQRFRWLLSQVYLEQGNPVAAEKELLRALELGVSRDSVVPMLARAYYEQGKHDDILTLSPTWLTTPSSQVRLAAFIALARLEQRRLDEARAVLDSVASSADADAYVEYARARLLSFESDREKALMAAEALTQRYPVFAPGWELVGDLHAIRKDMESASDAYDKVVELSPTSIEAIAKRGFTSLTLQRYELSRKDAESLVRLVPRFALGWYLQALVAYTAEDAPATVAESLDRVLNIDPEFLPALLLSATIEEERGGSEKGLKLAEQAVAIAPASIPARKLLAMMQLRSGNHALAEQTLKPMIDAGVEDLAVKRMMIAALSEQGRYGETIPLINGLLEARPDSALTQADGGIGLLVAGSQEAAMAALEAAQSLAPDSPEITRKIVEALLWHGDHARAELFARRALESKPADTGSWALLGSVQFAAGRHREALESYQRALEIEPGNTAAVRGASAIAMHDGRPADARNIIAEGIATNNEDSELFLQLAHIARQEEDWDTVDSALAEAIRLAPDSVQARTQLALRYLAKDQPEDALVALDPAITGNDAVALAVRSQALVQVERLPDARVTMERLVELRPKDVNANWRLAELYEVLGLDGDFGRQIAVVLDIAPAHLQAVIAAARRAFVQDNLWRASRLLDRLPADSTSPEVLKLRMAIARQEGDAAAALEYATRLVQAENSLANRILVSRALTAAGESLKSRQVLEEWLASHPDDVFAYLELAAISTARKDQQDAVRYLRRAVELAPENAIALNNLAWTLKDDRPEEAMAYAERAVAAAPDSAGILDTYAAVLAANARYDEALTVIDRLIESSPDSETLLSQRKAIEALAGETGD